MRSQLENGQLSVLEAKSRDDLVRELQRLASQLGFQAFSTSAVVDHFVGKPAVFATVDNTPADYRESYNDPALARLDPVMQHVKAHSVPIVWDQSTYVKAGRAELWEQQAPYGYRCGISLAMHLPFGKTAWEIGRILGIAENTAIRHAHSASRKLGCSGKHHAVVKALRLGLTH